MDLALTDEQQSLFDAVARMLSKRSSPEQVRQAEPLGFDATVWRELADMGLLTMGVDGAGEAAFADMAVVARAAGAHLAPVPVVEAMVANRLLARAGRPVDEATVRTLALRPARDGRFVLVPGGAVASVVVGVVDGRLIAAEVPAPGTGRVAPSNLGSAPLADIELAGSTVQVLAEGGAADSSFATALDEWRALSAQWLIGLGRAAFELGVRYAKDRHQFGVAIGSFQAVQHRLADLVTALDGTTLLADKAIWALDTGDEAAAILPVMAFVDAGEVTERATSYALHLHGGYGFMEEYDIQLYFRRAKAARLVLGDPRRELQRLSDRLFGPVDITAGA